MKKTVFLLPALPVLLSGCALFDSPPGPDARPVRLMTPPPPKQAPGKTVMPEAVKSAVTHHPRVKPERETGSEPPASSPGPVTTYPMQTDGLYGTQEIYRDLNAGREVPDYLQTKPRERDPFYDSVNRTGSNPMNTRDITTNRPAWR